MVQPQDSATVYTEIDQMILAFHEQLQNVESALKISRQMVMANLKTQENPHGLLTENSETYLSCLDQTKQLERMRTILRRDLVKHIRRQ